MILSEHVVGRSECDEARRKQQYQVALCCIFKVVRGRNNCPSEAVFGDEDIGDDGP
jgi:hypothetical protein